VKIRLPVTPVTASFIFFLFFRKTVGFIFGSKFVRNFSQRKVGKIVCLKNHDGILVADFKTIETPQKY
jgi:hypothetical protein